jgi:hypothetical protein
MALTLVEIVLLNGRQGWTQRQVADEFNARHPERNPITHSAVGKLVKTFKETGSVVELVALLWVKTFELESLPNFMLIPIGTKLFNTLYFHIKLDGRP